MTEQCLKTIALSFLTHGLWTGLHEADQSIHNAKKVLCVKQADLIGTEIGNFAIYRYRDGLARFVDQQYF